MKRETTSFSTGFNPQSVAFRLQRYDKNKNKERRMKNYLPEAIQSTRVSMPSNTRFDGNKYVCRLQSLHVVFSTAPHGNKSPHLWLANSQTVAASPN